MKKFLWGLTLVLLQIHVLAQTTLPTSWNFSAPGISTPPTGWTLGLGTNGNLTYGFGIGDALSCRLDATGEYFSIQFTDKPGTLSYYLSPQNAGAAWGGQFDIQESADGNSWTTLRSITSKATTATNFTGGRYSDYPSSTARYIRFFYTTKLPGGGASPGGNMGVDSVWIQAAAADPGAAIAVKKGTTTLVANSTVITGNASSTALTIENKGTSQTLSVDSVKFTGAAASDFSVTGLPLAVSASSSSTLNVAFTAGASGSRKATMLIYSNDLAKSPFVLNLYSIGGNYASEPSSQPTNLVFSNVKSYAYNATFSYTGAKPEHFIVLRKKGSAITEVPADGISYMRGDYIGSAQVEKICDSIEQLAPNYIFANTGYYYALFSFNGPAGFENYLTANPLTGSVTTPGKTFGTYYNSIDPSKPNFITSLSAKINPHDTIFYSNNIPRMVNPWLARDTSNGMKVVTCVYTNHQYVYNEPFQWANGTNGAVLTREHTWCQSWMPSNVGNPDWPNAQGTNKELPEYNDLFNLYPAHQANANLKRSNYPLDEVVTPTYTSPTGFGMLGKDSANRTAYEPRPEHKGDVARTIFYMAVCYNGVNGKNWSLPAMQNLALLRQWNQMDPPDNYEIARHEFAAAQQGNRNPFIDHPEWADRIDFYTMSYIPVDTTTPKKPVIVLQTPVSTDIWEKGKQSKISWTSTDVDTIMVYFSDDSLKTQTIITTVPAAMDSLVFTSSFVYSHPSGIVILKDKYSPAADTSTYFKLSMVNGIASNLLSSTISIYPNPAKDELFIDGINTSNKGKFVIYNFAGIKVIEGELNSQNKIDIKDLNEGYFVLQIQAEKGTINKVFIKN